MKTGMKPEKSFVTLEDLARSLGLPAAWLKGEAKAGRIPSLRVRRRTLFHVPSVELALTQRPLPPQPAEKPEERHG
jgi:hypothetical protein